MKPLLIKFDLGLLKRIELEVAATSIEEGRDVHRTDVIRDLITEGLDKRCERRNEVAPYVLPVSDEELSEGVERVKDAFAEAMGTDVRKPIKIEDCRHEVGPSHETITFRTPEEALKFMGAPDADHDEGPEPTVSVPVRRDLEADAAPVLDLMVALKTALGNKPIATKAEVFEALKSVEAEVTEGDVTEGSGSVSASASGLEHEESCTGLALGACAGCDGKTAEGERADVCMEGDADEVRSGGNSELAAAGMVMEVPEVGPAGGRGWLGDSIKPIGLN